MAWCIPVYLEQAQVTFKQLEKKKSLIVTH